VARAGSKTVRFTQVVERSGEPQVHTLWLPPDKDPELQRAQKAHRVMTVEAGASGGKADVGRVGFDPDSSRPAQFLIFPKSLKLFEDARVVGIKFDLVSQPKLAPVDPAKLARSTTGRRGSAKGYTAPPVPLKTIPATPPPEHKPIGRETQSVESPPAPEVAPSRKARSDNAENKSADAAPNSSARAKRSKAPAHKQVPARITPATHTPKSTSDSALIPEIRAAMKELERGKAVAAYQRLERALSNAAASKENDG
jgi:hypothetical protein